MLRRSKLYRSYERVFSDAHRPRADAAANRILAARTSRQDAREPILRVARGQSGTLVGLPSNHTKRWFAGLTRSSAHRDLPVWSNGKLPCRCDWAIKTIGSFLRVGQVLRMRARKIPRDTRKVKPDLEPNAACRSAGEIARWPGTKNPLIPPGKGTRAPCACSPCSSPTSSPALCNQKDHDGAAQRRAAARAGKRANTLGITRPEHLSLKPTSQMRPARACFTSAKSFIKSTGLSFTDYVARLRVEEARTQFALIQIWPYQRSGCTRLAFSPSRNSIAPSNALFAKSRYESREGLSANRTVARRRSTQFQRVN